MSYTKIQDITKVLQAMEDVHIRASVPARENNANKKGMLFAGFEVEVTEEWKGENINGNNRWYRDKNGDFLWSGGFQKEYSPLPDIPEPDESEYTIDQHINYNQLFENIPDEWRNSGGRNVRVAVLDSGVFINHRDFEDAFKSTESLSKDYTLSSNLYLDSYGHGTHIAGLIGARTQQSAGITGIAPGCTLLNLKVLDNNGGSDRDWLKKAYNNLNPAKLPDIINLSLSISKEDHESISEIFDQPDIIQVAAAGNNGVLFKNYGYFNYPAMDDRIISVGVIDLQYLKTSTELHPKLDYLILRSDYESCSIEGSGYYHTERDSSQAAALLSGIIALILSAEEKSLSTDEVKQHLDTIAMSYGEAIQRKQKNWLIKCH